MNLKAKIDLIFGITVIVVGVLIYVTFQNVNYVKESSDLVHNTNKFLYDIENLESSIIQIEASNRGFIISGNEQFLVNLENAKKAVYKNLDAIKNSHNGSFPRLPEFDKLENLVRTKLEVSDYGVYLRKTEGIEPALQFVSAGKGKALMDEISKIIQNIEKQELELLSLAVSQNEVLAIDQNSIYIILSIFIFSILLVFHLHIRKNTFNVISLKETQANLIKKLNHQNKQLDDFVNIVSHNVRSPANNISALISLLNDKSCAGEHQNILEKLNKVSGNLNETLDELLDVIHIKQDVASERESLAFKAVCDKVIDSLQGDILLKDASITCNFEECPAINYPKAYLESIFHNLISNAIKYSSPDRKLKINVTSHFKNGETILKVTDNGLGMNLKRIGDKIFGLRKTFHTTVNSKGIGLFMTKTHIEAMGGEISVESEVNKGSVFTVIFEKNKVEGALGKTLNDKSGIFKSTKHKIEEIFLSLF